MCVIIARVGITVFCIQVFLVCSNKMPGGCLYAFCMNEVSSCLES